MQSKIIANLIIAIAVAPGVPSLSAYAQEPIPDAGDQAVFDTADANGDGQISYQEAVENVPGMTRDRFEAQDRDGDGTLAPSELEVRSGRDATPDRVQFRHHFDRLDADGSGEVSLQEFQDHHQRINERMFSRFDADRSGGFSPDEMRALRDSTQHRGGPIARADQNGDGELSLEELSSIHPGIDRQRFSVIDTDGSGTASMEELRAARDRFGGRHHGAGTGKRHDDR